MMRRYRSLLVTLALAFAHSISPGLAHEGHDHDKPPPLNLPVAPRVIAVTPQLELVGVMSGSNELTVFLHDFATNAPVAGAKMTVSADTDTAEAKPEGDGIFSVSAPWIGKAGDVDLIFALTLPDGSEDLLTGRLETLRSLETAMTPERTIRPFYADYIAESKVLWAAGLSFAAGLLFAALLMGVRRQRPASEVRSADSEIVADASSNVDIKPLRRSVMALFFSLSAAAMVPSDGARAADNIPTLPSTMATDQPQRMPDGTLFVPKATQHLLSIKTEIAALTKAAKTIELSGRVTVGPQNLGRIQSSRPGRFQAAGEKVGYVGMKVDAGQILGYIDTYIEESDRANIVSQIAETEARIAKSRTILSRFESLPGAVPPVKVDEVRGELQALIKRRDELLPSMSAREPLVAPIGGVISIANVAVGQVVEQRDILFEIIDPSEFWIEAITSRPEVANNLKAAYAVIHDHDRIELEYLGRGLELKQHSNILNFRITRPATDIAVGMTAKVILQTNQEVEGFLLPTAAIVPGPSGLPIVWIKRAPERFEPQFVKASSFDGQSVVVHSGVKIDDRIVTGGVTLLNQVR